MRIAGPNLMIGSMLFLVVFGISTASLFGLAKLVQTEEPAAVAAEGGGDEGGNVPGGPATLTLISNGLSFDKRSLAVSTGSDVTVVFDNQDPGVLHNFAVYTDNSTSEVIFQGELFTGPEIREEKFTAPLAPGSYFFRCDVHPDTMTGTFSVR